MQGLIWTTFFLPLIAAVVIALFTRGQRDLSARLSIGSIVIGFVCTALYCLLTAMQGGPAAEPAWLEIAGTAPGDTLSVGFGLLLDSLSLTMLLVVTGVGMMIQIYSRGYMKDDPGYSRYFACLSFFTFSMMGIVLATNFVQMFIFWELVGVSSYLLIGFWFGKPAAADAGKKAFITNRLGDFGFLLGILILWSAFGEVNFAILKSDFAEGGKALSDLGGIGFLSMTTVAGLLIFCGAVGKSAQFPLHVWLPDAMEGPTPVSALIHAATMVAAGVYMLCLRGRIYLVDRGADGGAAGRHQANSRLFHAVATWLHGHGRGDESSRRRRRRDRRDVSSEHARRVQGPAVSWRGLGDLRAASRAEHLEDGRSSGSNAGDLLDILRRNPGVDGLSLHQRFLQQGRHSSVG